MRRLLVAPQVLLALGSTDVRAAGDQALAHGKALGLTPFAVVEINGQLSRTDPEKILLDDLRLLPCHDLERGQKIDR